jgi:hypothetical protein
LNKLDCLLIARCADAGFLSKLVGGLIDHAPLHGQDTRLV